MRLVALLLIFLTAAGTAWAAVRTASAPRLGQSGEVTRFALDLSESVPFEVKILPDPDRVVVLLPEMRFSLEPGANEDGRGIVRNYRIHVTELGSSVVLDLVRPATVLAALVLPPRDGAGHRLVIDLRPRQAGDAVAATLAIAGAEPGLAPPPGILGRGTLAPPPGAAGPAPAGPAGGPIAASPAAGGSQVAALQTPPPLRKPGTAAGRRVVVLDPGHGGADPGAISAGGYYEKEITLAMAQEMRRRLLASGRYTVLLTREGDAFVPLSERVRLAREAQADLFVSIHADSIGEKTHRGGTVYTQSQTASDKEAEALAARENKADIINGVDFGKQSREVMTILIDLAQRETMNLSAQFAQLLSGEMGQRVPMNRNAHRFAGFRVLSAPDVPSVLIELGYLSNEKDETLIRSPAGRGKFADALVEAVDRYFAALNR